MADGNHLAIVRSPTAPIAFDQMKLMAKAFADSGMFGVKTEAAALSLLMIGDAEGMHPAQAIQEFDIIENKPSRKSERIQARFQLSGGKIKFLELTDKRCAAEFSHPQGADVMIEWTIAQAQKVTFWKKGYNGEQGKRVSLLDKDNWKNYPRAMLRARVISEGCKSCFPGYAIVTLSTEEALDGGTLESVEIDDDGIDQRPEEELTGFIRGAAKNKLVADLTLRMERARSPGELDGIVAEFRSYKGRISNNVLDGLEYVADVHAERVVDGVGPIAGRIEENPFEGLKEAALLCADKEVLNDWLAHLTPDVLGKMTEPQRNELRTVYANMKEHIGAQPQ